MSAPAAPLLRPHLRPWLGVLLPFCALGLLPWWACLALCAALALERLGEDSRSVAVLLVLLAAVLVSGPLLLGHTPDRLLHSGNLFAQAAVVGLLSLASLRALEQGRRRGLLLPALALLLFPSPGGLAALLLSALSLNGAEAGPLFRLESGRPSRTVGAALGAAALLAGAALLLGTLLHAPQPRTTPAVPRPAARPAQISAQPPPAQAPETASRQARPPEAQATAAPAPEDQELLLRPLVPFTGLLVVVCMVLLLGRMRRRQATRRSGWAEYAALAGMIGTLFMLGVLGAGAGPDGQTGAAVPQAAPPFSSDSAGAELTQAAHRSPDWLTLLLNGSILIATVFFAAAAVYLYLTFQHGPGAKKTVMLGATQEEGAALPPQHRIRLAWRGLEAALGAAGLARSRGETPEEFSARLSALLPAAAADLHTLTRLYLPVRYGPVRSRDELSEEQALSAEQAAASIRGVLRTRQA